MKTYDEHERSIVANADRFFATAYRGGFQMYEVVEASTLRDARHAAASLYDDRPIAIYAERAGRRVHVENHDPSIRLFQETLNSTPFWMIVMCVLVNKTSGKSAKPILEDLRRRWPTPSSLAAADFIRVAEIVSRLGLGRRRSADLIGLAAAWTERPPKVAADLPSLPGCEPYARDSWAIFVDGDLSVEPTDAKLSAYLDRVRP